MTRFNRNSQRQLAFNVRTFPSPFSTAARPHRTPTSLASDTITSQANLARSIQMALRLVW